MAIRHNSPVLVIIWPDGKVEVTQVLSWEATALMLGAQAWIVKVNANVPDSLKELK